VVIFGYKAQIVKKVLAHINSKKKKFKQPFSELWRFQSPTPISIGSNFNNKPNGQQKQGPCRKLIKHNTMNFE
jgi:hypothetical protein